jgi:predicted ATPase
MDRPHVRQMRVVNFGCVKDVTVDLTPLHAFVGPNDSGKSTLLRALRAAVEGWEPTPHSHVTSTVGDLSITQLGRRGEFHDAWARYENRQRSRTPASAETTLRSAMSGVRMLRLDPDEMRLPSPLIPKAQPIRFSERGRGLPGVYDALLSRRRKAFDAIGARFRDLFPTVQELELSNTSANEKVLSIRLTDGTEASADAMSEGMLYWLAFAAIPHLAEAAICLIEEPENGLHPARVSEVVRVLRAASQHTQILLATHSPLVINELEPDEVTIITRTPERGTIATPMTQTRNFAKRSKAYALGELWLSYADGDLEEKLVGDGSGDAPAAAAA